MRDLTATNASETKKNVIKEYFPFRASQVASCMREDPSPHSKYYRIAQPLNRLSVNYCNMKTVV